jgi:7-carboxy-7-deazaguanine synthase
MTYAVNDLYAAIQGEGCLAGTAMVLVRLHGCGVGCPFCDTKETWRRDRARRVEGPSLALGTSPAWCEVGPIEIAAEARWHYPGPRWALVTGGEPAEQALGPLCAALHDAGFKVALETSGTAAGYRGAALDWFCLSPKLGMPGCRAVLPDALEAADEIKHVVGRAADVAALDELLQGVRLKEACAICLQPMSLNERATELCTRTVLERGWRLSLQTHRLLGLR